MGNSTDFRTTALTHGGAILPKTRSLRNLLPPLLVYTQSVKRFIQRMNSERGHLVRADLTTKTLTAVFIALPFIALFSYNPLQREDLSGTGLYADMLPALVATLTGDELYEPPEYDDKIAAAERAPSGPAPRAVVLSAYKPQGIVHRPLRSGLARAPPAG